jgi:putative addiction module component (TIGR02574 family)
MEEQPITAFVTQGFPVNINETLSELSALPVPDRLRIVESLWNSIDSEIPIELSPEQQAEIDRRLDAHRDHPSELLTWEQVLDQLRARNE